MGTSMCVVDLVKSDSGMEKLGSCLLEAQERCFSAAAGVQLCLDMLLITQIPCAGCRPIHMFNTELS